MITINLFVGITDFVFGLGIGLIFCLVTFIMFVIAGNIARWIIPKEVEKK